MERRKKSIIPSAYSVAHIKFEPYFFVEIPKEWTNSQLAFFTAALKREMKWRSKFLKSVTIVVRKKFYGFTNGEEFKFARLCFSTHDAYKNATYILKKRIQTTIGTKEFQMYEANIDPMLRFCHVRDIKLSGWARIEKSKYEICEKPLTYSDIEINVASWKNVCAVDNESIAPFVQASFDIETYSHDGSFPDPNDKGCPCIQIATTLQRCGEKEAYKRVLISLGTCDPIEGVEVIECKTERRVLDEWSKLINKEDVDILIGYNIWGFDLHYMFTRANIVNASQFFELGRFQNTPSSCKASSFSSGAYGDSDYQMVDTLGRFQLDLLVVMKREHKLTSYSLNAVSEHFLKDKKVDMPYKEMFRKYKEGTSKDRNEIGVYCVKDTDLPLARVNKLAIVPNMIEMSKATWVPINFLIERGQGIKVFSQILYQTRQEKMLVITINRDVWKCECGHTNRMMYESCQKCKLPKPEEAPYVGATVLSALDGAYMDDPISGLDFASLYPTIMRAHNLCHSTFVMDKKYDNLPEIEYYEVDGHKFAQNNEGILPKMLRELAQNRKTAKKAMFEAEQRGDAFMQSVYNGKQLAFKVSMNSIYGFTGAIVGFLPCKPVASCTTSIGRGMIEHTKNKVEEWYPGAVVVYGDSVAYDTPILVRINKRIIKYIRIEMLYTGVDSPNGEDKLYQDVTDTEVYTEVGWTNIQRVMKHRLDPTKCMYRVHTHCGIVDVTSDHSLLSVSGNPVKPSELVPGRCLLSAFPDEDYPKSRFMPEELVYTTSKLYAAQIYASAKTYHNNYEAQIYMREESYCISWKKKPFKFNEELPPHPGHITKIEVLPAKSNIVVYDLTTDNHHFHAGIGELIVHNTDSVMVKFDNKGKKGKDALGSSFDQAIEAAGRISATFKHPIELEFEKVYLPYLLFSKKRYAGLMYTKPEKPDYIDAKGIQLVRRDNCPFVRKVSKDALNTIMYDLDVQSAIKKVKEAAEFLLNNKVPIDDLVVSKSLKRLTYVRNKNELPKDRKKVITCDGFYLVHTYANANLPHITVACKKESREPGVGPKSGDRVPYVFIDTKNPKDLQYAKAEDPEYAKEHNLQMDVQYYLEHGLQSPLESLFSLFLENPKHTLFNDAFQRFKNKQNTGVDIYEFLGLTA